MKDAYFLWLFHWSYTTRMISLPTNVEESVSTAERMFSILEDFLPAHKEELEELRRQSPTVGTESELDIAATIASFQLFFMITCRHKNHEDIAHWTLLNASLIEEVHSSEAYSRLTPLQRVRVLKKNGLVMSYSFVWK